MADWAGVLSGVPDYLGRRSEASGRLAEKLQMIKPMPVTQDPGAAAIEGAVGGALVGNSIMSGLGGATAPVKAPSPGLKPKPSDGVAAMTPAQAGGNFDWGASGPSSPAGGGSLFSSFFNFFK